MRGRRPPGGGSDTGRSRDRSGARRPGDGADSRPPRLARLLLARFLPAVRGDELLHDLAEDYRQRRAAAGRIAAAVWYWGQTLRPAVRGLGRELREVRELHLGSRRAGGPAPLTFAGQARRDLRVAARRLRRTPGFTLATVLTLGFGIGTTVAIYSAVDGVVLRPLPYPDPDRLVVLDHTATGLDAALDQSHGTYVLYRDEARSLAGIGVHQTSSATLAGDGEPERVELATVTRSFFDVLAVPPVRGRTFTAEEDRPGGPPVVVIGQDLWQRRFGEDPDVVGRTIDVDGLAFEVVGVMPSSFEMPAPETDLWFPQQVDWESAGLGGFRFGGLGRLADGVTMEAAAGELQAIVDRIPEAFPYPDAGPYLADADLRVRATPLHEHVLGGVERTLWIVLGGVGLVLLVACANVANLLLVRGEGRSRELAMRRALGASRGHLLGDALAESAWLGALGGALGYVVARLGIGALGRVASDYIPRFDQASVHGGALGVTVAIACASCVLFGALPALRGITARSATADAGRRTTASRERTRLRQSLVITQIALALLLLVGAALLGRSYQRLQIIDPGFEAEGALTFELQLPGTRYPSRVSAAEAIETLRTRLEAIPGVLAAGSIACLPLGPCAWENRNPITRDGQPRPPGELPPTARVNTTSPGYFRAMGIPLLGGRTLTAADHRDSTGAAVVDRALADRFWPGEDPLGKRVYPEGAPNEDGWYTVVGLVGSVRTQDVMAEPEGMLYLPQVGTDDNQWWTTHRVTMTVRTDGEPLALVGPVRAAVGELDSRLALARIAPMTVVLDRATARSELAMLLLGLAAGMALVLGLVGVYGVISYVVSHRRGEIGLRMALGATASDIGRMVLGQAGRMGLLGIGIGLAAAFAMTRLMRGLLYDVAPTDPASFIGVTIFIALVTVGAAYAPARRAARVDPARTLRAD